MKNKKVFVTGGANGIGRSIVTAFVKAGSEVAFCDTDEKQGKKLAASLGGRAGFFLLDVTDINSFQQVINKLFNKWGDIDIIINNVGISEFSRLTETSIEQFDKILSTNLRPVFITSQMLAAHRNSSEGKKRYGRIINMASTRYLQSEPGSEGYAASKGGIVSLTHALAISLGEYNITVNCITPGWIETKDYGNLTVSDHHQHPSGRVGQPEDISNMCLYLCAEENDFINGQNIVIDGGMTKKMIYEEE